MPEQLVDESALHVSDPGDQAMKARTMFRVGTVLAVLLVATVGTRALRVEAARHGNHCPRGIKTCAASQVGQPCDPNNLNVICSAQADGSYCCLAYAP
jgi:hypothetical protein